MVIDGDARVTPIRTILRRSALSLSGPISFACANLLISFALLQTSSPESFGLFAFAQVVIASGMAISSGLFGAPAVVALSWTDAEAQSIFIKSFFLANASYCVALSFVLGAVVSFAGANKSTSLTIAFLGAAMAFRWFLRSIDLAKGRRKGAGLSDVTYGISVTIGIIGLYGFGRVAVLPAVLVQLLATLLATIPLAGTALDGVKGPAKSAFQPFFEAFWLHGRWAVAANAAVDVATNSQVYILVFLLGPAVFAPLAFATLLFRPLGVVLTGLVQFELPQMARTIDRGDGAQLNRDVLFMRFIVGAAWVFNALSVGAVFVVAPSLVLRDGYQAGSLIPAVVLTAAIVLIRAMREPGSAALQAHGEFKTLAKIALTCAPMTLLGVLVVLMIAPQYPALTLLGALSGESINLVLVLRRYRDLIKRLS